MEAEAVFPSLPRQPQNTAARDHDLKLEAQHSSLRFLSARIAVGPPTWEDVKMGG